MAPLLRFETAERGFARDVVERHSPQAGFDSDRLVDSGAVHSVSGTVLLERRDNTDGSSNTPVASMPSITESTKALVGITVFLSVVVLAVAGLRLRKFLRNRRPKDSRYAHLKTLSLCHSPMPEKIISEKRRNPMYTQTLLDFGYDGLQPPSKVWPTNPNPILVYSDSKDQSVGWKPQIESWSEDTKSEGLSPDLIPRPFLPPSPPAPAVLRSSRFSRFTSAFARSPKPSVVSFDTDAVPPYTSTAPTPRSNSPLALPDTSNPVSSAGSETKPSPPPKRKHQKSLPPIHVDAPTTKVTRVPVPAFDTAPVPDITVTDVQTVIVPDVIAQGNIVKSPSRLDSANPDAKRFDLQVGKSSARRSRKSLFSLKHSSSAANPTGSGSESGGKTDATGKKLPRLVAVVSTFVPTMQDELRVRVGEVLRMTHEFRDGWCAVERLGKEDEYGVVPRFCVADRPSIIPDGSRTQSLTGSLPLSFTGSSVTDPAERGANGTS